jgi:hypothetical protein
MPPFPSPIACQPEGAWLVVKLTEKDLGDGKVLLHLAK